MFKNCKQFEEIAWGIEFCNNIKDLRTLIKEHGKAKVKQVLVEELHDELLKCKIGLFGKDPNLDRALTLTRFLNELMTEHLKGTNCNCSVKCE